MQGDDLRIAAVSDVTLGYGSPQIPSLARSLANHYRAYTTVFEPDQGNRPVLDLHSDLCHIRRVTTDMHPYSRGGRIEYALKVARALNATRPDIVVVFCSYAVPVLARLRYRPRCTIYSMIESVLAYGAFDVRLNRSLSRRIDLLVSPEENRARSDISQCGFSKIPVAIAYNVSDKPVGEPVPLAQRMPRVFYGGAISRSPGMADYFLRKGVRAIPFDLFGSVSGPDKEKLAEELASTTNPVCYCGHVDAEELGAVRKGYAYSIVMYEPTEDQTLYACPNKFFEAIADGVPPIAAPHPQCKMLLNRYRCGILMRDWSFEAFQAAVKKALEIFGTDQYAELVANCREAVRQELNWEAQFDKVRRLLPKVA